MTQTAFQRDLDTYLPNYVFAYYSGWSSRLERHFDRPTRRHYDRILKSPDRHLPLRRLFFCRKEYSQLVLLAFFLAQPASARELLERYLGIKQIARGADPRTLGLSEPTAAVWSIALIASFNFSRFVFRHLCRRLVTAGERRQPLLDFLTLRVQPTLLLERILFAVLQPLGRSLEGRADLPVRHQRIDRGPKVADGPVRIRLAAGE